jgi:S-layer protein
MERLLINDAAGDDDNSADTVTLDVAALGFTNYVQTNGTVADATKPTKADTLVINNLASGGTVEILASAATANSKHTVQIKNAATGAADVLNLTLTNASSTNFGLITAASTETVNLVSNNVSGAAVETQTATLTAAGATTLNISGSNKFALTLTGSTALTTIDASANTGGVSVTSVNTTSATTMTGGSGNDTLVGAASGDILSGGGGADSLTAGNLTTMTGGGGNDTFKLSTAPTSLNTYATITDFSVGDVLDTTATTMNATQVVLADTASFQDFANAAVGSTGASLQVAWFQFGGNTYVVVDKTTGGATFDDSNDFIIKLAGLHDLSTANFNTDNGTIELPPGG